MKVNFSKKFYAGSSPVGVDFLEKADMEEINNIQEFESKDVPMSSGNLWQLINKLFERVHDDLNNIEQMIVNQNVVVNQTIDNITNVNQIIADMQNKIKEIHDNNQLNSKTLGEILTMTQDEQKALDDLTTAVTANTTAQANATNQINTSLTELSTLVKTLETPDNTDVVNKITAVTASIQQATAGLETATQTLASETATLVASNVPPGTTTP